MIKAVVFDLDHTLFDRYATITAVAPKLRNHFEINPDYDDKKIADTMISHDKSFVHRGWNKIQDEIVKTGMILKSLEPQEYHTAVMTEFAKVAIPFDFTKPMLSELINQGYKIGLITNGNAKLQHSKLDMLGLNEYFDYIYIGGEHEVQKPHLEPFFITAEILKVEPSECVYVGDNPINDVDASRKAGYLPIHVNTTENWICDEIEKPKYSVKTVKEIPELLKQINV